jgi:phosphate-selective porin OprO/OprP
VDDDRDRFGADLEWIYGPAAVRAELVRADWGDVRRGASEEDFDAGGWFVEGSCILTGEAKRRNRGVAPATNFDPAKGQWGALELVGRYEGFTADDDALAAGLATGTDEVRGYTVGLNWYPNKHMAVKIDLQDLRFDDTVTVGSNRVDDELVLFLRFQLEF